VHADKISRTRETLRDCAERGIRISGPKLGRPYKDSDANKDKLRALKRIMKRDEAIRQEVESVFGVGKRRYGLDRIVAKTKATSESMIMLCVLVMNLDTILRDLFLRFFGFAYCYRKSAHGYIRSFPSVHIGVVDSLLMVKTASNMPDLRFSGSPRYIRFYNGERFHEAVWIWRTQFYL